MKALIVDDEHLALLHFKKMLERTNAFQSIMAYQDPVEALEHPETPAVDAVFLDIEMPGVNGIELAEAIQSMNENIQVVFITAYNEFAIKAFELNAIDYLLKPVIYKRLETTVERIKTNNMLRQNAENTEAHFSIQCFGSLQFHQTLKDVKTSIPVKWRTSKAREIYLFLLHNQGHVVSKEMLIDLFGLITMFQKQAPNFTPPFTKYENYSARSLSAKLSRRLILGIFFGFQAQKSMLSNGKNH